MTTTHALRIDGVSRRFGRTEALADVSFTVPEHTICGLLGRNGAGKTTLMSILAGHDRADRGSVQVFGADPFENAPAMSSVSFLRDNQRYPDDYYLKHVLRVGPLFHENWSVEIAEEVAERFRLPAKPPVKKYSRGQLSALGVLIGLASRAPLTIFDEPYLGLDATARQLFYDLLIREYSAHPRTILMSTHLIDEMDGLLEHVVVLDRGRVVRDSTVEDAQQAAFTVSGPATAVEKVVGGARVLRTHRAGGLVSLTIEGALTPALADAASAAGVQVQRATLQDFVAALGALDEAPLTTEGIRA
ncbi:ABC transporter ATP-binding protein [Lysobacter korlensis]|uniref:ABC transporter ATP-binding protein n=1 Tax=Lysobacter korlensis TaxID=553636 RepID=A0ABV6RVC6_9GAMM